MRMMAKWGPGKAVDLIHGESDTRDMGKDY